MLTLWECSKLEFCLKNASIWSAQKVSRWRSGELMSFCIHSNESRNSRFGKLKTRVLVAMSVFITSWTLAFASTWPVLRQTSSQTNKSAKSQFSPIKDPVEHKLILENTHFQAELWRRLLPLHDGKTLQAAHPIPLRRLHHHLWSRSKFVLHLQSTELILVARKEIR